MSTGGPDLVFQRGYADLHGCHDPDPANAFALEITVTETAEDRRDASLQRRNLVSDPPFTAKKAEDPL